MIREPKFKQCKMRAFQNLFRITEMMDDLHV